MRDKVPAKHAFKKLHNYHQIWPFVAGEDDWWMEDDDPRPTLVEPLPRSQNIAVRPRPILTSEESCTTRP